MNLFFRNAILSITFFMMISGNAIAQNESIIAQADSLFNSKKYTEAFQRYFELFSNNQISPASLMKMAFIKEGLGDYTQALYFLNLYYNQTNNKKVLSKMRELAEEHHLEGYEYSDSKFILGILDQYNVQIILCLSAIVLFMGGYVYKSKHRGQKPYTASIIQLISLTLIFILSNNFTVQKQGIITRSNTIAVTGPSAGAEPIELIERGHKIIVLDNDEIWSKILWHDQEVFIRSNSFKRI